jgi:predicted nucleic acid-binding protein
MILVVADTSPLRHLIETGHEFLLPRLFTKVWIPGTVTAELRHARSPGVVRQWAEQLPSWVEVRQVEGLPVEHELVGLDRGEWEAIELAKSIRANLLQPGGADDRFASSAGPREGWQTTENDGLPYNEFSQDPGFVRPDAGTCGNSGRG